MMHILIVCTGNTCRSPLAEVLLRERLAATPALANVTVSSAGTGAWDGSPASEGSYLVALERGLDLSAHRAHALTAADVARADLILTMGRSHLAAVQSMGGGSKAHTLVDFAGRPPGTGTDVPDPIGGDVAAYRRTAEMLDTLLGKVVARLAGEGDG